MFYLVTILSSSFIIKLNDNDLEKVTHIYDSNTGHIDQTYHVNNVSVKLHKIVRVKQMYKVVNRNKKMFTSLSIGQKGQLYHCKTQHLSLFLYVIYFMDRRLSQFDLKSKEFVWIIYCICSIF